MTCGSAKIAASIRQFVPSSRRNIYDRLDSDVYIISKGTCGEGVGQIPVSVHKNLALGEESEVYGMMPLMIDPPTQGIYNCNDASFRVWQGADMRQDGKLIAMITGASPPRVYFYPRLQGQTVLEAFTSVLPANCPYISSVSYGLSNERKHEAVAFVDAEGTRFADTSECQGGSACNVPIYFYDLIYPDTVDSSPEEPAVGWIEITNDDFEDEPDHVGSYVLGGGNAFPSQNYVCADSWAIHLNYHNGVASSFAHLGDKDCSGYSLLRVNFKFQTDGFDHMDTLFLELSLDGGQDYYIVGDWAQDVDGITTNRECYDGSVFLVAEAFDRVTFGSQVRLRFRSSANAANDRVYIDSILFEGHP
jgi:hypothetical protein